MKKLLVIGSFLFPFLGVSQEPEIDRVVEEDREKVETDNSHSMIRWGYHSGSGDSDSLSTLWSSNSFNYSGEKMIRPAKFYSLIISYGIQYDNFKLEQDSSNLLSPGMLNEKQHLHLYTGRLGIQNRFHLSKHGTKEGTYIEVGAVGSIKVTSSMRIQNDIDPKVAGNQGAEEVDAMFKKLKYTDLIGYYGTAAIGRNGFSLYGEYRLSDLFKKYEGVNNGIRLPELTPLNVGIRLEF